MGDTFLPTNPGTCNGSDWQVLQTSRASGISYATPSSGVLTSWSFEAGADPTTLTMRVYRPTGTAHEYEIVADAGELRTVAASSGLNTFPTRIAVKAGDFVGIRSTSGTCATHTSNSLDTHDFRTGPATPVGTAAPFSSNALNIWDISAELEADADGDGFGDETQDDCPTDATTQGACQADLSITKAADKASASVGESITYTMTVRNNSASTPASAVSLSDTLPSNVTFVSATPSQGSCTGSATCALGDLAPGAAATVSMVVRAAAEGTATNTATVSSALADPNPENNAAFATTDVNEAAAPDITDPRVNLKVKKRQDVDRVKLFVRSDEDASLVVRARVSVPVGVARTFRFKTVRGSLDAGVRRKVRLRLKRSHKRIIKAALDSGLTRKAKVTITVTDEAGNATVKRRRIRLTN